MTLLVANRWDIRRVTLSNNRYTAIVKGLHNAIALDFHHRKGLMFWSDVSTDVIKMVYMNGTRVRDVIKWGLESPGGIAVDWIHDLLFWTDSGTRRVEVSNFQGNLRTVIASYDLDKPRAGYPDCTSGEDEVECHLQCDLGQFLCPTKQNITNLK